MSAPLDDLVVLDLTIARAGPTAVRYLADWGARVLRIEQRGDGGAILGDHNSSDYINLHRSKQLIGLDLTDADDKRRFFRLVEHADIIVENNRAPVKTKLGIDYEACAAVNPRIIYGSIAGYGQDGPASTQGRRRPDHPGRRRTDEHHRAARPGPGARRHRGVGLGGRPPARHRHPARPARTGQDGPRAVGEGVVAGGDDLVPRLPGRALDHRRPRPAPGGQPPPDRPPDGDVPGGRRLPQRRRARWTPVDRAVRRARRARPRAPTSASAAPAPASTTASCSTSCSTARFATRPRDEWIALLDAAGVPCGPVERGGRGVRRSAGAAPGDAGAHPARPPRRGRRAAQPDHDEREPAGRADGASPVPGRPEAEVFAALDIPSPDD